MQTILRFQCLMDVRTAILSALLLLLVLPAMSQQPASKSGQAPPSTSTPATTLTPTTLSDVEDKVRDLTHRVQKLELELLQQSKRSTDGALTNALIAALALLGASWIAGKWAAERAKQEAVYRGTEKILEYRLKQMEQFYAPMFALLGQSKALYDKMLHQLAQDEPNRYKWVDPPDAQGYRFYVLDDEDQQWKGFRLLDQFPAVRSNPKALALAERILDVGKQMTEVISKHAGLASEDSMDLLGEYLAHYAILSTIYSSRETTPYKPGWHEKGYYPRKLNERIEAGYRELSQFLNEYGRASKRMLEALSTAKGDQKS